MSIGTGAAQAGVSASASAGGRVDFVAGAAFADGNPALHRHVLQLFRRDHVDDWELVRSRLAAGDQVGAERVAHSLKSVAALIGAKGLNSVAASAESELAAGGLLDATWLDAAEMELAAVQVEIERFLALSSDAHMGQASGNAPASADSFGRAAGHPDPASPPGFGSSAFAGMAPSGKACAFAEPYKTVGVPSQEVGVPSQEVGVLSFSCGAEPLERGQYLEASLMEAARERLSILIVDDDPTNLIALNKILAAEYDIYLAKRGSSALQFAQRDKPDLILLDVILPDQDGFDLLRTLKANDETRGIPVIFITGQASDEYEERGFELGAVDYIKRPFKGSIVRARVNNHMQMVRQLRENERLGMTDPLTDVPNRRCFDERLAIEWKRAMREQKPISFLMMDIDKFKNYNDTYGHQQGDALLKVVSRIFMGAARRASDLAARIGGEEFAVLLPDTMLENALLVAETIRGRVEEARVPTADGMSWTSTTISIGVSSLTPTHEDSVTDFIAKADECLYRAKASGRNRICPPLGHHGGVRRAQ